MSYRVDIPTLSANEVYTLTFEYEGTETIQLVVGDLTLETTDRRVVFTTTSPVNYIESNVNLTNLNIYEGYYESDNFGGEYTQESYIEGMSLVNLIQSEKHLDFQNNSCGVETFEDNMIKLTITDVSSLTSTWQHGWMKTSANLKVGVTYTCVVHVVENSISTEGIKVGASYGTLVHGSDSNSLGGGETGVIVFTYTTATATLKDYNGYYDSFCRVDGVGDWQNGSLKYGIMVFEGDYYDYFINNNIPYFEGIGCVKSPTIKSLSPENLYVSPLKYCEPLRGYEYYHNDGTVEIYPNGGGAYSTIDLYTGEDVGYSYSGNQRTWYVNNGIKLGLGAGTYYFCCEIELVANKQITDFTGRPQVDVVYDNAQYFSVSGDFTETYDGGKYYYKGKFSASYKTVTDDIRGIYVGIWSYGISGVEKYVIRNITLTREESLKDMCAISKSSIITTPDDLELYGLSDVQDVLDLTDGLVTRKIGKLTNCHELISSHSYNEDGGYYTARLRWGNVQNIKTNGNNTLVLCNVLCNGSYKPNTIWSHGVDGAYYLHFGDCTTFEEAQQYCLDNNLTILYELKEPTTEQLSTSINPLKSYRNGLIQTSSQQLTPTLKTTLPISNKFTTTNLTSGSTYNVYFDGTATKLDAGGTIITNPVSPCEVECGGTTLTIEGTDIQNVRVIETTVKNEVGSVCGTTDVELSRIKTKCAIHNMFDDYFQGSHNTQWAKDYNCTSTRDDTTVKIVGKGSLNYAGYSLVESLPFGTYKLHYKVKVSTIGDKYKVALSSNPNGIPQDAYVPVTDVTSTALVEEQTFVFYKKHITNMLFYTYTNGQEIEYYDISLIKLSDEDITGTDTSSINYSQVISDLEQPIKLRSLGTTYDSYNAVTGELVKRIGVSETDGSYSVLSSPIVNQVEIDNIPQLYTNGQVKVYSDSEVYPTTILNGQSTNNYEVNELNKSNNYTIRYDGTCESINLNGKSNEQGTNRIVKTSTNGSGNLTFVNDSGDIDNVLLTQGDVREQEINHFNGLQTVEVSKMIVQSPISKHLFYNHGLNDFVPRVNTNYSFDENNNLILSNGYGNNVDTMLQTVDKYTLEKGDSVIFRVVGVENFAADHRLYVKLATQIFAFGGYSADTYVNFKAPKVQEIINEQGYCDVVYTYNSETTTDNIQISNLFGKWIISSVVLCKQSQEIITPTIIDLPQPVQLNSLPDGTCDTYNPITGEYVQNVGYFVLDDTFASRWLVSTLNGHHYAQRQVSTQEPNYLTLTRDYGFPSNLYDYQAGTKAIANIPIAYSMLNTGDKYPIPSLFGDTWFGSYHLRIALPFMVTEKDQWNYSYTQVNDWLRENPIHIVYKRTEPITTQLTPITIPTFEGGILQLITTDGKVFPMIEYSMLTNNRYDTSSWETGVVYTQRNMTEAYFNESTTPMTPTETMTLTTDHISSGSIILNDNGNGLIVLKGNYIGRDIPYFTGMRSVEAVEVEVTPSPDQPLFGKGGRK